MKKLKIAIMTSVVLFSIVASYASTRQNCTQATQYILNGQNKYVPVVGQYGTDYICLLSAFDCTYTYNGSGYTVCRTGTYSPTYLNKEAQHGKPAKK